MEEMTIEELHAMIGGLITEQERLLTEGKRWEELCGSMLVYVMDGSGERRAVSFQDEYNDLVSGTQT